MKKYFLFIIILFAVKNVTAQNVGIGTTEPLNKLQVQGGLLVTTPTTATGTSPTVAQTKIMLNAGTITFLSSDSTGRIYDPGGPAGNYNANLVAFADIGLWGNAGIEITAETMGLGTGDSLIIKESLSSTSILLAVGNGYTTTGKWVFNSSSLYIIFKSNADANTGIGFSLLFRRLYDNSTLLPDISGATGKALFFDTKNGSFRSGLPNNAARGYLSTAMGKDVTASGNYSTALGDNTTASSLTSTAMGSNTTSSGSSSTAMGFATTASGNYSTAMGAITIASGVASIATGYNKTASGDYSIAMGFDGAASGDHSTAIGFNTRSSGSYSTAMGYNTAASGLYSTALGTSTIANGNYSTAMGRTTIASGDNSTAMGSYVSTSNFDGSFVIGDISTTVVMNSANANNFRARFAGGYKLFTSANLLTGCTLFAGDNAWTTGSDVRSKENFAEINGEDFLKKISRFHLTSWNYKTQNPATFRHYSPMAQDFHAAFGKDKYGTIGSDTTINSADFAGVSFIAIQALEKRTQKMEQLEKENASQAIRMNQLENSVLHQQQLIELMQKEMETLKTKLK